MIAEHEFRSGPWTMSADLDPGKPVLREFHESCWKWSLTHCHCHLGHWEKGHVGKGITIVTKTPGTYSSIWMAGYSWLSSSVWLEATGLIPLWIRNPTEKCYLLKLATGLASTLMGAHDQILSSQVQCHFTTCRSIVLEHLVTRIRRTWWWKTFNF